MNYVYKYNMLFQEFGYFISLSNIIQYKMGQLLLIECRQDDAVL